MKQLKLFSMVLWGIVLSTMMISCGDKNDEDVDPRHEMVPANAKGIRVYYEEGVVHETIYAWINNDVIKSMSSLPEDYKHIVEANYSNRTYYPLTMDKVEELILDYYSWKDIKSVNDDPVTKGIYKYVDSVKTKYKYVTFDIGVVLFNRTSDINY